MQGQQQQQNQYQASGKIVGIVAYDSGLIGSEREGVKDLVAIDVAVNLD